MRAAAAEFILEGLYAHRRISRNEERGFAGRGETRDREPRSRASANRDDSKKASGERPQFPPRVQLRRLMKWIKYSSYTGEDFGIDAEDLLKALSDFLLQSGFNTQYMPFSEWNQHTLEDLKQAIQQALEERQAVRRRRARRR